MAIAATLAHQFAPTATSEAPPPQGTIPTIQPLDVAHAIHGGLVIHPGTAAFVRVWPDNAEVQINSTGQSSQTGRPPGMFRYTLGEQDSMTVRGATSLTVEFTQPVTYPGEALLPYSMPWGDGTMVLPTYLWAYCEIKSGGNADLDLNGSVGTDQDIAYFYACLANGLPGADFDNDGQVGTDADMRALYDAIAGW